MASITETIPATIGRFNQPSECMTELSNEIIEKIKNEYELQRTKEKKESFFTGKNKKNDQILYDVLVSMIQQRTIKKFTLINVTNLYKKSGISKSTCSNAIQYLSANGYLHKKGINHYVKNNEPSIPSIDARAANYFSIAQYSKQNNIEVNTHILDIDIGNFDKFKHEVAWQEMKVNKKDELIQIRRLRQVRPLRSTEEFKNAVIEVSYISPAIPGFYEFYKDPRNKDIGFFEYYQNLGIELIKNTYKLDIRSMNPYHKPYWQDHEQSYSADMPFFRIKSTTYDKEKPIEFSHSYIHPKVLSFEIFKFSLNLQ